MLEDGIAINSENADRIHTGMGGYDTYKGFAQFAGQASTMALPIPFPRVKAFSYVWVGSPAADEVLSLDHATEVNDEGHDLTLSAGANGAYTLNVKRTGAVKTADLIFNFHIEGL